MSQSADYRAMFDSEYVGSWDLNGKDVTVTIERVKKGTVKNKDGSSSKAILYFKGAEKPMVTNKTNARTIAAMYGADTTKWIGQRITLYPTTTQVGRDTVDCIRVRPMVPKGSAEPRAAQVGKDTTPHPADDNIPDEEK